MIEYALLFGLGFLAAALLAMLVAPAIQRRIVVYAENRLKATMPLSPQEVRAQRDMARAAFAAEQAKTMQELTQERERRVNLQIGQETLGREAARLHSENAELKMQVNDMSVEAADLRSALRQDDSYVTQLQEKLGSLELALVEKNLEIEALRKQNSRSAADRDNMKIDLAARNAQLESDRYRLQTLREERDSLRKDVKLLTTRAKEAEQRLEQEEHKALRLSDRLAREQAAAADKDNLIERRLQEIGRLRDKNKTLSAEAREARKLLKNAPADRKATRRALDTATSDEADETSVDGPVPPVDLPALRDELRHLSAALSDRLAKSRSASHDAALRDELADVAARMVALTALEEGPNSPIHGIIHGAAPNDNGPHPSLGDRVRAILPGEKASA